MTKGINDMVHKITLMEAYLIETLLKKDIPKEVIITTIQNERAEDFQHLHDQFDFTELYQIVDILEPILEEGYQIKFLTLPGLINMLQLKLKKEENVDYNRDGNVISKLKLDEREKEILQTFLSPNWTMKEDQAGTVLQPVHSLHE